MISHKCDIYINPAPEGLETIEEEGAGVRGHEGHSVSGHNKTIAPRSSQQLWVPAKGLHKIKLDHIPARTGEGLMGHYHEKL